MGAERPRPRPDRFSDLPAIGGGTQHRSSRPRPACDFRRLDGSGPASRHRRDTGLGAGLVCPNNGPCRAHTVRFRPSARRIRQFPILHGLGSLAGIAVLGVRRRGRIAPGGLQPPIRYTAQWIEDLPATPATGVVYVIGGREYPYWAAMACPSGKCSEILHLGISDHHKDDERWTVQEHENESVSLSPSVNCLGLPCKCHFTLTARGIKWSNWR